MTERTCCDGLCNQGRACPAVDEDPQIHSDARLRKKHSLGEAFGRSHFNPTSWEPSGFPLLPSFLAGAAVLVFLALVASFAVSKP